MDKYNLFDCNIYNRIAKIMNKNFSVLIDNDPVLNFGQHNDIYSIYSPLKRFRYSYVENHILFYEYELKLRDELIQQSIKMFNIEKVSQILRLQQQVCKQIYRKIPDSKDKEKWKNKTISFYQEEEKKLKHDFITIIEHYIRLKRESYALF